MTNTEGLDYLTWDMFDCPYEKGSAVKFMERLPVLILDKYVKKTRCIIEIDLAYTSPKYADAYPLPSRSSHRVGNAVRIRCLNEKKRMKLIAFLVIEGVRRISFTNDDVYFDTDGLKAPFINQGFIG